jgi:nicotinate-nucleotide pyrophosphorylase (carboxylating)
MHKQLLNILALALKEDIPNQDITSELLIPKEDVIVEAKIFSKDQGVFFGKEIILGLAALIEPSLLVSFCLDDGGKVNNHDLIAVLKGRIKAILKIERVLLNLIQRLSGIASTTQAFVQKLANPRIKILDTRKTTPLWRFLEKQAVKAGGGTNHRFNLSDMILIKENHLTGSLKENSFAVIAQNIKEFKNQNNKIKVEIEIETLEQLNEYDLSFADYIMFDNFKISDIKKGIMICKQKGYQGEIEISGNITLDNIANYRHLEIDRISIGSLTHSVKALDISLLII